VTAKEFLEKEYPGTQKRFDNPEYFEHIMEEYLKSQLSEYTDFLLEEGYCDSDVYCEPPTAIDRFLHPKLR
jgi:hypothetical protein